VLVIDAFNDRYTELNHPLAHPTAPRRFPCPPPSPLARNGEAVAPNPHPDLRHVAPPPQSVLSAARARLGGPESRGGAPPRRRGGAALHRAVPRRRGHDDAGVRTSCALAVVGAAPNASSGYNPRGGQRRRSRASRGSGGF
jgi:hypothetical protein